MADRQVRVKLIIDDAGSVRAVKMVGEESGRTEHKLRGLEGGVKKLGSSFGGLKGMIGALGVGGLAMGLGSVISKTKDIVTETEKFHAITGIGTRSSLYYTQALKARGLSGDAVTKSFGILVKNIKSAELQENRYAISQGKATAKGKESTAVLGRQAQALKELTGLSAVQFKGLGSEDAKLKTVTKSFEGLAAGEKKTRLEKELLGRSGTNLSVVLEKNNLSINKGYELAQKFFPAIKGGIHTEEQWIKAQTESKMAMEGLEYTIGVEVMPAVTKLMGKFSGVVSEIEAGKGAWGGFKRDIEGVVSAGKGVVGFFEKMGKAFNIPVEAGGLGAALAAFAGIHTLKHPVKAASTAAKGAKGLLKFSKAHPELAPGVAAFGAGAAIPFASDYGIKASVNALSPGYLKQHSIGEINRSFLGGQNTGGGYGNTRLGGRAAGGAMSPGEASRVASLMEHPGQLATAKGLTTIEAERIGQAIARAMQQHGGGGAAPLALKISGDGPISTAIANSMLHDPRNQRIIAEAVTKYAHSMAARQ
jgi:hypothetical protein